MEGIPENTQWTLNHKTSEPFTFRSGGFFGFGKKAWTIHAAIKYMDRHPQDGIYHLENGTLAAWFENQHGEAIANLARAAARNRGIDARAMLETFLLETGLLKRPRMLLKPRKFDMIYILSGQKAELLLSIRKGRGRGHLFGTLHANESRVRVLPSRFGGEKSDISITLDTANLPITTKPQQTLITIDSSATEESIDIPIRFKVVSRPAPFIRWVIRPLVGSLFAGLLGAIWGALFDWYHVLLPTWLSYAAPNVGIGSWTIVIGIFWAILGALRGLFQPLSWPVLYALRRCVVRILTWSAVFSINSAILLYAWKHTSRFGPLPWGLSQSVLFLLALIFAIVPAALGEIWNEHSTRGNTVVQSEHPLIRQGLLILVVMLATLLALGAMNVGDPFIEKIQQPETSHEIQIWRETHLQDLEQTIDVWINQAVIRYYDKRAPSRTPAPERPNESNP
jgi:hypothetical protein